MTVFKLLPKLIRASLEGDKRTTEKISLMIMKKLNNDYPMEAKEIARALTYTGHNNAISRSLDMSNIPVDKETRSDLVKVEESLEMLEPVLDEYTKNQIDDFLAERASIDMFLEENIIPPNSVLFVGKPGVGKTYIAHWMAYKLNLPIITLDLASSISSYLGRSGQNIKYIFEYAKEHKSILFLDELDAIAKRRDDASDLGELKRLVNVLLKEIETYPSTAILLAATNHPELLDKAIWRRFDRTITIQMPDEEERKKLILRHLRGYSKKIQKDILHVIYKNTKNINAADICKLCEHIKRQTILRANESLDIIALKELFKIIKIESREDKIKMCRNLKSRFSYLSQRDISHITRIPLTSVSRYIAKEKEI